MGVPTVSDVGSYAVILKVNDGHTDVLQGFSLSVIKPSALNGVDNNLVGEVYPNPANTAVNFKFMHAGKVQIALYDITGNLVRTLESENPNSCETMIISDLSDGIYFYRVLQLDKTSIGKIIKE